MKITVKLTSSFLLIALLVLLMGYFSSAASQRALERAIETHSSDLAIGLLDTIDKYIYDKVVLLRRYAQNLDLQKAIADSNNKFKKLDSIRHYTNKINSQWKSADLRKIAPFMQNLINNPASQKLRREFVGFYKNQYGYSLFSGVFVTNKYGANCAQAGKTGLYMHDKEKWWQDAKNNALYIGGVQYAPGKRSYILEIAARVEDKNGNFIGVIKCVLDIRTVFIIIDELARKEMLNHRQEYGIQNEYPGQSVVNFDLLTKDKKSIYSTLDVDFLEDLSEILFFGDSNKHAGGLSYYGVGVDKRHNRKELFVYARSRGYRDFKGMGWILVVQHDTELVFAPSTRLRNVLLLISFFVTILAVLIGFFISRSISIPIRKLKDAAFRIGRGELDANIDVATSDEIGELANSFNEMAINIKKKQKELIEAKKEIESWSKTLEKKVEQRTEQVTKSQNETLEVMKHLQEAYAQLKETHFQLIQSEKMKAIGTMASGIAHEVKNPLGIIMQGVDYLDRVLSPVQRKEDLEILKMIRDSVERADAIICTLLNFSRAGELNIKTEDINSIIENSLVLVGHRVKLGEIELVKDLEKKLPGVLVDKSKMEQVFVNILINACHTMSEGGKLFIRSYQKRIKKPDVNAGSRGEDIFKINEKVVVVEIEDTGPGIAKDKLERIFDPFFTTKKVGEGTGLGLSIVKNIIDMHRGSIEARSKVGKGTKMIVTLKIAGEA